MPIDIKKPDNIRNKTEKLTVSALEMFSLFSKNTKAIPRINEINVYNRYLNLKVFSELIFLINIGMLPNINPIKQKLVGIGNILKRVFNIFPNKNTPKIPPSPIGNK